MSDLIEQTTSEYASKSPQELADQAKSIAIKIGFAGLAALLKWGYQRGSLKPTKYTIPIYAGIALGMGYYSYKYRQYISTITSKVAQGLTSSNTIASA